MSHVVIVLVVQHIGHEQNDCGVAGILPPVRGLACLAAKIAGLVHNWARAIAGVFYDLALLDVDQRWSVGVTMPRHDAARGDRQLAKAKLAVLDLGGLFAEINRT